MHVDRSTNIPIRHRFIEYVCQIGYTEADSSFHLLSTSRADGRPTGGRPDEMTLYLRILNEPALRANLLEALVPESKAQIIELREKAISERGKNYGFVLGLIALGAVGYLLYKLTFIIAHYVGYELAEAITYLPSFFAFLLILPVQNAVERWHARRYCSQHSHLLETFQGNASEEFAYCKRCGLRLRLGANLPGA